MPDSTSVSIQRPVASIRPDLTGHSGYAIFDHEVFMTTKPSLFIDIGLTKALEKTNMLVDRLSENDFQVLSKRTMPSIPVHSRLQLPLMPSPSNSTVHYSYSYSRQIPIINTTKTQNEISFEKSLKIVSTAVNRYGSNTTELQDNNNINTTAMSRERYQSPEFRPSKSPNLTEIINSPHYKKILGEMTKSMYFENEITTDQLDDALRKHCNGDSAPSPSKPLSNQLIKNLLEFIAYEIELTTDIERRLAAEKDNAYSDIERISDQQRQQLQQVEQRATQFNEKVVSAKQKIKGTNEKKRDELMKKTQSKHDKLMQSQQRMMEYREKAAHEALSKKDFKKISEEIEEMRHRYFENNVNNKQERYEATNGMRLQKLNEDINAKAKQRDDLIMSKQAYSSQTDNEFRVKSAQSLLEKEEVFTKRMDDIEGERKKTFESQREREKRLGFQAEQRRRAIETKKLADAAVLAIKDDKFKIAQHTSREMQAEIPHVILKVKQAYSSKSNALQINSSPGPGDYDISNPTRFKGGYMGGRHEGSSSFARPTTSPGPGHYDIAGKGGRFDASGALPFAGRGKTDVDWKILFAKQIPGPGYYDIDHNGTPNPSAKNTTGTASGIRFNSRGKTDLDWKILTASQLPGPGYYDVQGDRRHAAAAASSPVLTALSPDYIRTLRSSGNNS